MRGTRLTGTRCGRRFSRRLKRHGHDGLGWGDQHQQKQERGKKPPRKRKRPEPKRCFRGKIGQNHASFYRNPEEAKI
jgi:hypothetical protein